MNKGANKDTKRQQNSRGVLSSESQLLLRTVSEGTYGQNNALGRFDCLHNDAENWHAQFLGEGEISLVICDMPVKKRTPSWMEKTQVSR